jgi:methionyl-tRNA formyltransferase
VKLFRPRVEAWAGARAPAGTVLAADGGLLVATGAGAVAFGEAQAAGGRRMDVADWLRGRRVEVGQELE